MKKVDVIVKDLTTLELVEDASKGDIIDLKEVVKVDSNLINQLVSEEKNRVYRDMFKSEREKLELEYLSKMNDLRKEIDRIKQSNSSDLKIKELEVTQKYEEKINVLTAKYNSLVNSSEIEKKNISLSLENSYKDKINQLEAKIEKLLVEKKVEVTDTTLKIKEDYEQKLNELKQKLLESETKFEALKREKSALNVKNIGEDLEKFCDNEISNYMQNGLFNCKWYKDNKVIKEEGDVKGSKADFIFEIYSDETHSELLTSVCLEMKDENPDSVNRHSDSHFFKKLDENRTKKNCKYAILVSNLEGNNPNISPIYKVREYENMYVVRPAYMMVLLNLIASLTSRFAKLLLMKEAEDLELKEKNQLIEEFNSIKYTYLDKPLGILEKDLEEIKSSSESIKKAVSKIDEKCEHITKSYINEIEKKIDKFELELGKKIIKKID